ncbi:MAG: hypothetical protein NVSMB51_06820 [Solirubrobacteraceae bacterium]
MAIGEIIEAPITSAEQYDKVREHLGVSGPPEGALLHIAGQAEDGKWRIVQIWESRDAAEAWGAKVREAREALGIEGAPKITHFEVHNLIKA